MAGAPATSSRASIGTYSAERSSRSTIAQMLRTGSSWATAASRSMRPQACWPRVGSRSRAPSLAPAVARWRRGPINVAAGAAGNRAG